MSDRLVINVALTGMVPTKQDTPHIPISPEEIADDVLRCYNAGGSVFHIHARTKDGDPDYRRENYEEILRRIRAKCPGEIVICVSTSGRMFPDFAQRSQVLEMVGEFKPDMASLTLGSMNFPKQASVNTPEMISALAKRMAERDIVPEMEVFEQGMIDYSQYLIKKSILHAPYYYNLLLGSLGSAAATPLNLVNMVNALPAGATWGATGIGSFQFTVNALSIAMGGHVRVGLEESIYMDSEKSDLATNARLVERVARLGQATGREPATPSEARQIMGLSAAESGHRMGSDER
ncbi:MAG: 3-keto-5-aminohexanoate cleavage protein [Candidatus Latescibacteria bacterium]|nr:3-keto-5-aminohexanoate cleavage protein [Candidatus Latescibacterota bacterium]